MRETGDAAQDSSPLSAANETTDTLRVPKCSLVVHTSPSYFLFSSLKSGAGLPLRRETTRFLAGSKIRTEKRGSRLGRERQTNEAEHVDIYRQRATSVRSIEACNRTRSDRPVR